MKTVSEWVEKASIFCGNPVKQVLTKIDSAAPAHPATCCNSMLRSCYRSVGRNASAAIQARTSVCLRSSARPISVAAAALRNGPLATRRTGPSLLRKKTSGEFRMCLSTLTDEQLRRKMDTFNDLFVTAREEMEFASESKETTYFDEEAAAAKEAVDEAVALFEEVLSSVTEQKRTEIMRGSGLRVEQLKAELDQLLASDDH